MSQEMIKPGSDVYPMKVTGDLILEGHRGLSQDLRARVIAHAIADTFKHDVPLHIATDIMAHLSMMENIDFISSNQLSDRLAMVKAHIPYWVDGQTNRIYIREETTDHRYGDLEFPTDYDPDSDFMYHRHLALTLAWLLKYSVLDSQVEMIIQYCKAHGVVGRSVQFRRVHSLVHDLEMGE